MTDARDEYWYLDPEVDPAKITNAELRGILLKHNISHPPSAKKATLVALFTEQVLPQAAKLQRAQARTKRSARGIEDVPSSQASTTTEDPEDETILAPPITTTRRTSRRTMRSATEEEQSERAAPVRRSKTPSSTVPTKHARTVDADGDANEQPPVRRNRKSATPAVKQELLLEDESPFTQDNPFQSGSSPLVPDSAARDGRRRKTMGFEHKEKRKSDAHRRKTFQPKVEQLDEGIVPPTRRTFDVPISGLKKEEAVVESDGVETGEEFTPEERLELVRERAKNGEKDILPPRRREPRSKASGTLKAMSVTLLTTSAAIFGAIWRQEKYAVGFCGIGRDATSLAGVEVPEWAEIILPQCEPCPPHAMCYQNLEVVCDRDFTKKDHPLSLGGLIPLPPSCEPDSEKTRRITLVADRGVQVLRERRAKYECREPDKEGKLVECPEVSEAELKDELSSKRRKGMSQEEFEDLWKSAIGDLSSREEIMENTDGIKRSLRQTAERYIWQLVLIFLVFSSGSYGRYLITSNRAMEARAKQLASEVFNRLASHASLNYQEPSAYPELGISMTQLRDDILRAEFSSSRRQKLWEKVQKKVEHNSNVRAAVREGRSGDVARMWEWIGPIELIEDGRGSGRRESGRYSYGAGIGSSPPNTTPRETKELKSSTWEEGRPIY
ncbi:hypothetical protein CC78DRAFT_566210 [Lojkania enalia]|uniref:Sister chromatid separation protein n=1 Tax=Lojkania enalia TaxID=147567 RepID=A0A9P4N5S6_9PLEO|nr:hypothetical protein CC78DRAFT_566210 [Didymosphaeria enalia]